MSGPRFALALALAFVLGSLTSACTALIVPGEDDDGVTRCELNSDCPDIEDNRYIAVCVSNMLETSDKVCSSDFDEIACSGNVYDATHPLTKTYFAARTNITAYLACTPEQLGKRGCGPGPSGCELGLEPNRYGTCDLPHADIPAVGMDQVDRDVFVGRDVQDQFCRSYFCDERFVCDTRYERPKCVLCDPDKSIGRGGCGTLYVATEASGVYLDVEAKGNCEGDKATEAIEFGPTP